MEPTITVTEAQLHHVMQAVQSLAKLTELSERDAIARMFAMFARHELLGAIYNKDTQSA